MGVVGAQLGAGAIARRKGWNSWWWVCSWLLLSWSLFFSPEYQFFVCDCRKLRIRRSIKVPAISNKVADIPADEFSWRKYGQKPIKGSPHPRYRILDPRWPFNLSLWICISLTEYVLSIFNDVFALILIYSTTVGWLDAIKLHATNIFVESKLECLVFLFCNSWSPMKQTPRRMFCLLLFRWCI